MRPLRSYKPPAAILIAAFLCLPFVALHAQQKHTPPAPPPATIKATVDKDRIVIGEHIRFQLEIAVPDNIPFDWPDLDSLPHFDLLDTGKIDTTGDPGLRTYRQSLTVTSFDSGTWAIPRLPFLVAGKKLLSDSIRIAVGYTRIDSLKDFHDIKDIIDIPNPFARWFAWIVALFSLGSLALVIWLVRKKKIWKASAAGGPAAPALSPYEEAIRLLDELQRQDLPETGAIKTYYSRLGDIFRVYLYRRLGIQSLSETSEEMISQLRRLPLPAQQFSEVADTLRMSDFVKFAKYQPGLADTEGHFRTIRSTVEELESIVTAEEKAAAFKAAATKNELINTTK